MQYIVFENMDACSEPEVARLLLAVSEQRRKQALQYKHLLGQFCCLKSYEMLMELLEVTSPKYFRKSTDLLPTFIYNEYGQPQLSEGPYFSISHCKKAIAVAVSDKPIGIDVELIRNVQPALIDKTMSDMEKEQIASAPDENVAFTRLWTQKEAYLKMKGTGIITDLKTTLMDVDPSKVAIQTFEYINKGYVLTLAHATIDG